MKRWWVGTAAARRAAQPSIAASRGGERAAMSRRMGRRDGEPGGVAAASVAAGSAWVRIGFVYVSSSKDFLVFWVFLVFLVYLVDRAGGHGCGADGRGRTAAARPAPQPSIAGRRASRRRRGEWGVAAGSVVASRRKRRGGKRRGGRVAIEGWVGMAAARPAAQPSIERSRERDGVYAASGEKRRAGGGAALR